MPPVPPLGLWCSTTGLLSCCLGSCSSSQWGLDKWWHYIYEKNLVRLGRKEGHPGETFRDLWEMNLLRYMWIFACPHLTFNPWFGVANCPPIVLTQTKRAVPCQNPNTAWASGNNRCCVFRGQRYHATNLFAFCCTREPAQARALRGRERSWSSLCPVCASLWP